MICILEFAKPIFIKLIIYVKVKENYSRKQINWVQLQNSKWLPFLILKVLWKWIKSKQIITNNDFLRQFHFQLIKKKINR